MSEETGVFVSNFIDHVRDRFQFPERVYVFDTTLRDGEQMPGVCYTLEEKLAIARQLDKLGVDVIEAGFPVNSEEEAEAVAKIAAERLDAKICGLARCVKVDIDVCLKCDVDRVHVFIGTSDIHLKWKLKMSEEEALQRAIEHVEYVKCHGVECEFSCEDATRTPLERLVKFYTAVENAGADVINVPDTVGCIEPTAMEYLISRLREHVSIPISVHCHNDMGLATANTLAGVKAGARQVHVTINGLGERAGNASLEQVVTSLEALYKVKTGVKLELLTETSRLVERFSMIKMPPNYPVVGDNAFAHEAGIHVHGVLERAACYEPLSPELVGQKRRIVMGKHTGKHAVSNFIRALFKVDEQQLQIIVEKVKELSAKKKKIVEDDVIAIAQEVLGMLPKEKRAVNLSEIVVVTGNKITPTASVQLEVAGERKIAAGMGVGPVDAASSAIQRALGEELTLINYKLEAISGGTDALASVEVVVGDPEGNVAKGVAVSGDIVMASVSAIIEAINHLYLKRALKTGGG